MTERFKEAFKNRIVIFFLGFIIGMVTLFGGTTIYTHLKEKQDIKPTVTFHETKIDSDYLHF